MDDPLILFRFLLALSVVIGLVLLAGWAGRRFGFMPGTGALRGRGRTNRRLQVVEVRALDTRRRLILVRRDDREHLLLIGGSSDLLVEGGIAAAPALEAEPTEDDTAPATPLPRPTQDHDEDPTPGRAAAFSIWACSR